MNRRLSTLQQKILQLAHSQRATTHDQVLAEVYGIDYSSPHRLYVSAVAAVFKSFKRLEQRGLVERRYGVIVLTEEGLSAAQQISGQEMHPETATTPKRLRSDPMPKYSIGLGIDRRS